MKTECKKEIEIWTEDAFADFILGSYLVHRGNSHLVMTGKKGKTVKVDKPSPLVYQVKPKYFSDK